MFKVAVTSSSYFTIIILSSILWFTCAFASTNIKICIPEQNVPPFYIHQNSKVSGETITQLNLLFNQPNLKNINKQFVIQPWQRCLLNIEKGNVDLIVAGYSKERATKSIYPNAMGLPLEKNPFSFAHICMVKKSTASWSWNGKSLKTDRPINLALESGFIIPDNRKLPNLNTSLPIWDTNNKFELLRKGRVDAVLTVCGVKHKKLLPEQEHISTDFEVIYPPFISSPVYLVFSKAFYNREPNLTKMIVSTSGNLNNKAP